MTGTSTMALAVLQWMHVLFAIVWFGASVYSTVVLWPEMRKLPSEHEAALLTSLRSGRARTITVVLAIGTVGLGVVRGIAGGVLDSLDTRYGITFLAAAVVGVSMVIWVLARGFGTGWMWVLPGGFFLMLTLMVAMRFGY